MSSLGVGLLAQELSVLSTVTSQYAWADDDQKCKIIPVSEYVKALTVAIVIAKEQPHLSPPVPGADPEGFLWLTYQQGDTRGLALEIRKDCYRWTQSAYGDKRRFESTRLEDVVEAMRSVFLRPEVIL